MGPINCAPNPLELVFLTQVQADKNNMKVESILPLEKNYTARNV